MKAAIDNNFKTEEERWKYKKLRKENEERADKEMETHGGI